MQRSIRTVTVLFYAALLCSSGAVAQDWPQWRGQNRDAKASGFHAPDSWPKELTKKWQVKVGDGVSTPALVDAKLYVFTREDGKEVLRCLDATTGNEIWQQRYETEGASGPASRFAGPRSSPAVSDGKVVTLGVRGVLIGRDAASGKQLWRKDDFTDSWPMFFTSSSPIVVDSLCIAQLGGRQNGGVIAFDLATGDEKWKWLESGPAYGSPVLMDVDGIKVVIAPTEGKLVAIGTADGKLMWEIPYSQGRYISATPIVDGSTVIVAGPGTGMTAFKLKKQDDKLVEEKLWSNTDNSLGFNTPVLKNGLVFGLSGSDQLFCINTLTQKTAWSSPLAKPAAAEQGGAKAGVGESSGTRTKAIFAQFVQQDEPKKSEQNQPNRPEEGRRRGFGPGPRRGEGPGPGGPGRGFGGRGRGMGRGMGSSGYGSVVDVGSALLGLSPAGELVVFKPGDEAFTELARYKVADGGTYAYPVPAGNGIYIKDQDSLTLWTVD
jgi:outer membrane protein assembly factor BamB